MTTKKTTKLQKETSKKINKDNESINKKQKEKTKDKEKLNEKEEKVSTSKKPNKVSKDSNKEESKKVETDNNDNKVKEEKTKKRIKKEVEPTESEKMQKIEEERKKRNKLPEEIKEKVNKNIFANFIMAIAISIYLIFLNLGYTNINETAFIIDLQVFSIALIITTILVFEHAYKKDSGKITIYGIETLVLSIITMILPRVYNENKELFVDIVGIVSIIFIIYYFIKCIIIYAKTKRKVRKKEMEKIAKK